MMKTFVNISYFRIHSTKSSLNIKVHSFSVLLIYIFFMFSFKHQNVAALWHQHFKIYPSENKVISFQNVHQVFDTYALKMHLKFTGFFFLILLLVNSLDQSPVSFSSIINARHFWNNIFLCKKRFIHYITEFINFDELLFYVRKILILWQSN